MDVVVMLPGDADSRFQEASRQQSVAESDKRQAASRIERLTQELDSLEVPTELLGEAERVNELYLRLGNHRKSATDLVGLTAQQRTARDNAKQAIEKLGWELSLDEAAAHRVADEKKALVRRLAARHGEVTRVARDQQRLLAKLKGRQAELERQLADREAAEAPTGLRVKLTEAMPLLEIEDRLAEQRAEVERLKSEAEHAVSRLTRWTGTLDEACRLKVPSEETVESFDESLRKLQADDTTISNQVRENREDAERVTQDLQALELADSVPTEDELRHRRAVRDHGVVLAVQKLRGMGVDVADEAAFVSDVGEGDDLPTALEPSIRSADLVADRLRRESQRVAEKSQLLAKHESLSNRSNFLDAQKQNAVVRREAWDAEWRGCWQETDVDPATPAEMRSWLRRHAEVISLASDWRSAAASLSANVTRVQRARKALASELAGFGGEVDADASLRGLCIEAERRLVEADAALREREQLQDSLDRTVADARDAETERLAAEDELVEWREAWAKALKPLRLDVESLPEQAEAVLGNLDEVFEALDERTKLGKRIWGIEETAKEFIAEARAVCEAVATDLVDMPVEEIAATLNQRLSRAIAASQQEAGLRKQLEGEQEALNNAIDKLGECRASLDSLVAEAGCDQHANLPAALDASARKRRLAGEVQDLRSQLTPFCAGKLLHEFIEEAESEDPDRLPSQISQLDEQVVEIKACRDEAIRAREETAGLLRQFGGESAAADKVAERQFLLSQLEEDVRDYAVAVVASRLLQRAVERYQEKSQGPVLTGASKYFAELTCGSFACLRPDLDEQGAQVLLGSRPDGVTLPVQAMSEGTRDQLYLALRLGTIDHWMEQHGNIPMVFDDVLLTFDDGRAAATLRVLQELAEHCQILFFTHHQHLVSLVRSGLGDAGGQRAHICDALG